jgi:hypothetical protein
MGVIPTLIEGFDLSPADFPFIHHCTVDFVSSLPWCCPRIALSGRGIFYL